MVTDAWRHRNGAECTTPVVTCHGRYSSYCPGAIVYPVAPVAMRLTPHQAYRTPLDAGADDATVVSTAAGPFPPGAGGQTRKEQPFGHAYVTAWGPGSRRTMPGRSARAREMGTWRRWMPWVVLIAALAVGGFGLLAVMTSGSVRWPACAAIPLC